jgi:hypothetical protein
VSDWTFAQTKPEEHLARLHHFSMMKQQDGQDIEFLITVYEYHTPRDPSMKFYAATDKQTNQKTTPFTPVGWGNTLLTALAECVRSIHRFRYEP